MSTWNDQFDGPKPHPSGDRMVFLVPSDRNPKVTYRVDCLENNGAMKCQCVDFTTRRQPAIDAGQEPLTSATMCKHCRKVVRYFVRDLFRDMARSECDPSA